MKKIKLLSLALAVIMMLSAFAGCGNKSDQDTNKAQAGVNGDTDNTSSDENDEGNIVDAISNGLTASKIGSISQKSGFYGYKTAVSYIGENGKDGIMSFDGKNDSGAKYAKVEELGDYFKVNYTERYDADNLSTINGLSIVDKNGKEVISQKYAMIEKLSDRYVRLVEATKKTNDRNDAIIYLHNSSFSLDYSAADGDILFEGKWYIYDLVAGKMLDGASGTSGYKVSAYGNIVKYVTDANQTVIVNEKGEKIPENATLLDNGYYALSGNVYDSNNNKVFSYSPDGFCPFYYSNGYIIATKYENYTTVYALMDTTGKVVSGEFKSFPAIYGSLILADSKVYNFDGSVAIEGDFGALAYRDDLTGAICFSSDSGNVLVAADGSILYQAGEDSSISVNANFSISKKVGYDTYYYSFADKDFTINGSYLGSWLVKISVGNMLYDVVDTFSGKTIISGYTNYNVVTSPGCTYVYAIKDGITDIYTVK